MSLLGCRLVSDQKLLLDTYQQVDQNDTILLILPMDISYDEDMEQRFANLFY